MMSGAIINLISSMRLNAASATAFDQLAPTIETRQCDCPLLLTALPSSSLFSE